MVLEFFTALVGFMALVYAGFAKFVQNRLVDRSKVEGVQAESKRLSEAFKKAKEKGNQKEMDKIMKEQMELLPKMNKVMMAQFKPMIFILVIFFAFTWILGQIDPFVQDDLRIELKDDGAGCDGIADDGIYSACIEPRNEGKWVAGVRAFRNGAETAFNATYFMYVEETDDSYTEDARGEPLPVYTDKATYAAGESVKLFAKAMDASQVEATLDNATAFRVDLPLAIPILNVQRIYQPYWWFILVSLICNLSIGFVVGRMKKK